MTTTIKPAAKKARTSTEGVPGGDSIAADVGCLLHDVQGDLGDPSPFSLGWLLLPKTPATSSSSSPPLVQSQAEEIRVLKAMVIALQVVPPRTSPPVALPQVVVEAPSVTLPAATLAGSTTEFLNFFKTMEEGRVKQAAEVAAKQSLDRKEDRKEDLKSLESLSKKLAKKDSSKKYNLKQTAILMGTGEALSLLAEGCLSSF